MILQDDFLQYLNEDKIQNAQKGRYANGQNYHENRVTDRFLSPGPVDPFELLF